MTQSLLLRRQKAYPSFLTCSNDPWIKLKSIKIFLDLARNADDEEKLVILHSGVLPELYLLMTNPGLLIPLPESPLVVPLPDSPISLSSAPPNEDIEELLLPPPAEKGTEEEKTDDTAVDGKVEETGTKGADQITSDSSKESRAEHSESAPGEQESEKFIPPVIPPLPSLPVDGPTLGVQLRDTAFTILDAIATNASDPNVEIIADAYVNSGIHQALVALLKEPEHDPVKPDCNCNCLWVVHQIASGTDHVKDEIVNTDVLPFLCSILDSGNINPMHWSCLLLRNLLSSEELNEDIVLAIEKAGLIPRLVKGVRKKDWNPDPAARAMSHLLLSTEDSTWDTLRKEEAVSSLMEYCKNLEAVELMFGTSPWILVEYLDHPKVEAQKFGLFLVGHLLKGGISHKKTVTNTAGMRDALEACLKSDDTEVQTQAKELIAKLPKRRR